MGIPEWEEIAIPEGFGPHRLLYNPPSETVIAELRSIGEQFFPNQLYIRRKDSPKYESIKDSEQMVHQHVGEMKTEASQKPVPIDGTLAAALQYWSTQT